MGWGNLWQNKDRFGVPSGELLQQKFQRLCKTFYTIQPRPSCVQLLLLMKQDYTLPCPLSTCGVLLFFKHKESLSYTDIYPKRGLQQPFPRLGTWHATAITNDALKALLQQTLYKNNTVPIEKTVPSVFTSRHKWRITANKIIFITLINDLKQSSFPVSKLMCQSSRGNSLQITDFQKLRKKTDKSYN